jgi:putative transcriptional regulator
MSYLAARGILRIRGIAMYISYDRLWKLLIDKKMNKQDLKRVTKLSSATIAKLGKGANVTTGVLIKICDALDCELEDIMELIK